MNNQEQQVEQAQQYPRLPRDLLELTFAKPDVDLQILMDLFMSPDYHDIIMSERFARVYFLRMKITSFAPLDSWLSCFKIFIKYQLIFHKNGVHPLTIFPSWKYMFDVCVVHDKKLNEVAKHLVDLNANHQKMIDDFKVISSIGNIKNFIYRPDFERQIVFDLGEMKIALILCSSWPNYNEHNYTYATPVGKIGFETRQGFVAGAKSPYVKNPNIVNLSGLVYEGYLLNLKSKPGWPYC